MSNVKAKSKGRIVLDGDYLLYSSLSQINFEIGRRLSAMGYEVGFHQTNPSMDRLSSEWLSKRTTDDADADLVIHHKYPPKFHHSAKRSILILPWEFTSIPKQWKMDLKKADIDQIWVPSSFVKNIISGYYDPDAIKVIPNGFDPAIVSPDGEAYSFPTGKKTVFLYVGGTIPRKGPDVLLEAFVEEFTDKDDVALYIKDFYYGDRSSQMEQIRRLPNAPDILYYYGSVEMETIAAMYRSASGLIHPFRAEGFGMPMLEAMASKLPVIATGYGPVREYADNETAYLLDYRIIPVGSLDLDRLYTEPPEWAEPDKEQLKMRMREVYEQPQAAKDKAEKAYQRVKEEFTWDRIVRRMADEIDVLLQPAAGVEPPFPKQLKWDPLEDTIDPVQKHKINHICGRNKCFNYEVRVLRIVTDYHAVSRTETRMAGNPDWETKGTDIELVSRSLSGDEGVRFMQQGDMAQAEAALKAHLEANQQELCLEPLLDLTVCLIEQNKIAQAGQVLKLVSSNFADHSYLLHYFNGVVSMKRGDHARAETAMSQYLLHSYRDYSEHRKKYAAAYLVDTYLLLAQPELVRHTLQLWNHVSPHGYQVVEKLKQVQEKYPAIKELELAIPASPYWTEEHLAEYNSVMADQKIRS